MTDYYAIILAAGEGRRMGAPVAKQYLEIGGKPVLRHTIERFLSLDRGVNIIVVLPPSSKEYWKDYCYRSGFIQRYVMASGGLTRFHSVQNALEYVPDGSVVAVHDGVRPLVGKDFLNSMFDAASTCDGVIPVLPPVETMRILEPDGRSFTVDRSKYAMVQTPQVFKSEILKKAYRQPYSTHFTDDASVVEAAGYKVEMCPGTRYNLKITTPEDLAIAEALLPVFNVETVQ